jgi:hypothetical protein
LQGSAKTYGVDPIMRSTLVQLAQDKYEANFSLVTRSCGTQSVLISIDQH